MRSWRDESNRSRCGDCPFSIGCGLRSWRDELRPDEVLGAIPVELGASGNYLLLVGDRKLVLLRLSAFERGVVPAAFESRRWEAGEVVRMSSMIGLPSRRWVMELESLNPELVRAMGRDDLKRVRLLRGTIGQGITLETTSGEQLSFSLVYGRDVGMDKDESYDLCKRAFEKAGLEVVEERT